MTKGYEQRASIGNWLYDAKSENERDFFLVAFIPNDKQPYHECTDEEKLAWEEAHKPEEPQPLEEVVE